jgi:hypothetical protein
MDNGQPERQESFKFVLNYYGKRYPVFIGSGPTTGEARNDGALGAIAAGASVLFFVDADIVIPYDQVDLATKIADYTGALVYGYGAMTRLYKWETTSVIAGNKVEARGGHPEAGACAIRTDSFCRVYGFPRMSISEDAFFHNICMCFLGPVIRVWGDGFHLWHPESNHVPEQRIQQIIRASEISVTDTERMQNLIKKAGLHDVEAFESAGNRL